MSERNTSAFAVHYSVLPFSAARLSNWGYHGPCVDPWSFRKSKQTNHEFWLVASTYHTSDPEGGGQGRVRGKHVSAECPRTRHLPVLPWFPVPFVVVVAARTRIYKTKVLYNESKHREHDTDEFPLRYLTRSVSTSASPPPPMLPAPYLFLVLRNAPWVLVWADVAVLLQSVGLKRSKLLYGPENNK